MCSSKPRLALLALALAACPPPPLPVAPALTIVEMSPLGTDGLGQPMPAGRINSVAHSPSSGSARMLAVSDYSLFASDDEAAHWHYVPGMQAFGFLEYGAIAFDPFDGSTAMLAASSPNINGATQQRSPFAGVYRSTDAGDTWSFAGNALRPPCPLVNTLPSSFGPVFFDPSTAGDVYVANGCEVGISHDHGASFVWEPVGSGDLVGDVTVAAGGRVFACGQSGFYERIAANWVFRPYGVAALGSVTGLPSCRIAAAPGAALTLFVAGKWSQTGTTDLIEIDQGVQGMFASFDLHDDPKNSGAGDAFAQVAPIDATHYRLYAGNDTGEDVQTCRSDQFPHCASANESQFVDGTNWHLVTSLHLHADHRAMVLRNGCIRFVPADGGVIVNHGVCDGTGPDSDWAYANLGIDALEPYQLGVVRRSGVYDVYLALQDNDFYFSLSPINYPGTTAGWHKGCGANGCGDGFLVAPPQAAASGTTVNVLLQSNAGLSFILGDFSGATALTLPMVGPGGGVAGGMAELGGRNAILAMRDSGTSTRLYQTTDLGGSWTPFGPSFPDRPSVARPAAPTIHTEGAPTIFAQIDFGLYAFDAMGNPVPGPNPVLDGVSAVGVDNAQRLCAFACDATCSAASPHLTCSSDGGLSWSQSNLATHLLSGDWFSNATPLAFDNNPINAAVSAIAFDPADEKIIAVGTRFVGILVSIDGGVSWGRVPAPAILPNVTSIAFTGKRGEFLASSYGRGVWRVQLGASALAFQPATGRDRVVRLTDLVHGPLAGRTVKFSLFDATSTFASASGVTDAAGATTFSIPANVPAGMYRLRGSFEIDEGTSGHDVTGAETELSISVP